MKLTRSKIRFLSLAISIVLGMALVACMKSGQESDSISASPDALNDRNGLDASHGGARIVLPEIDPLALNKTSAGLTKNDSLPQAWLELTISGDNMAEMFFQFPLGRKGGYTFEIKSIPSGKNRSFYGRLVNRNKQTTHEGTTVSDIRGGEFTDLRLYLAKATGGVNVCVVIEGQALPPCAVDTIPQPPPPDPQTVNHCWYIGSDSISGRLHLYDDAINGYKGMLVSNLGAKYPVSSWFYSGDSLYVYMLSPSKNKKWIYSGPVQAAGNLWIGTGFSSPTFAYVPFYGKPIPCTEDTIFVPPVDTVVVPPKDTSKSGFIPRLTSSEGEVSLCFGMRLDLASKCEIPAFAKLSFVGGNITRGYVIVGDKPNRTYTQVLGRYDEGSITIESVLPSSGKSGADSMIYKGIISSDRTMAKGDYIRSPLNKSGLWTAKTMVCPELMPKFPEPSCPVPVTTPK